MADRRSLRLIGFVYGSLTGLVMLVAGIVVSGHVLGHWQIDQQAAPMVQLSGQLSGKTR